MDLIVFGDDWQAHQSTTQHLINQLPATDRIIWCNSIGMRAPQLNLGDIKRILNKLTTMFSTTETRQSQQTHKPLSVVQPKIIPLHSNQLVRLWNQWSMQRMLSALQKEYDLRHPIILTSNPVVSQYLPQQLQQRLYYLRLDNYALYGGVDSNLAVAAEEFTFRTARHTFYTAQQLRPSDSIGTSSYLPQGVDINNFRVNPLPKGTKTLGYFGLIESSRFDFDLIYRVASTHPDWNFEFMGDVTYCPDHLRKLNNIIWRDKVKFTQLSESTRHWHAAWIPYHVNSLTNAINPLKVREYLALGLAVISSKMPEVLCLDADINFYSGADDFSHLLESITNSETDVIKQRRSASIKNHSWSSRSCNMRALLTT